MSAVLQVKNIKKNYGKKEAVRGISFDVNSGEVFALIGPNGAGKTTTLRMIATLLEINEGDALISGVSIKKDPGKARLNITYLPDEAGAYKNMKGIDYLKFMASICSPTPEKAKESVEYARSIVTSLGDAINDKIGSYSKGMTRKLLIARAVMTRPQLAILDEPTSGLDILNGLDIRKFIKDLAQNGNMSFLVSSHNMLEIDYLSSRVAIIDTGIIHALGSPADLKAQYSAQNLEEVFQRCVEQNKNTAQNQI